MALYASFPARSTCAAELATLGAVSAPLPSLGQAQLFVARAPAGPGRPGAVQAVRDQPIAVHSSTSVPSGQRT